MNERTEEVNRREVTTKEDTGRGGRISSQDIGGHGLGGGRDVTGKWVCVVGYRGYGKEWEDQFTRRMVTWFRRMDRWFR